MDDIFLFENDLQEYQNSDEGRAVGRLLEYNDYDVLSRKPGVSSAKLKEALDNYWDARNGTGLHFSDKERRKRGIAADTLDAELYREQN